MLKLNSGQQIALSCLVSMMHIPLRGVVRQRSFMPSRPYLHRPVNFYTLSTCQVSLFGFPVALPSHVSCFKHALTCRDAPPRSRKTCFQNQGQATPIRRESARRTRRRQTGSALAIDHRLQKFGCEVGCKRVLLLTKSIIHVTS